MAQLLGRAYIKVDGDTLRSNTGASLDVGGPVRNAVVGNAVHGYAETIKEAVVECEISLAKGDVIDGLRSTTASTITFECDTGQVYVVRDAWLQDPPKMTDGEGGKIPLTFGGQPAELM